MDNLTNAELLSAAHEYLQEVIRRQWALPPQDSYDTNEVASELLQAVSTIKSAAYQADIPLVTLPLKPEGYEY